LHVFWLTAYLEAGKKIITKKQRAKKSGYLFKTLFLIFFALKNFLVKLLTILSSNDLQEKILTKARFQSSEK